MKRNKSTTTNKQTTTRLPYWYEICGEAFFTQLIVPFLSNPSRELKSLSQTCRFIYRIYSSSSHDLWLNLLLEKYLELNREMLENWKGKLMMIYYQLIYFENHLDKVPEHLLCDERDSKNNGRDSRPLFISASSYGYYYAQGFVTMLIHSYFDEDYDPTIEDTYTYNLEMDNNTKKRVSFLPTSIMHEYSAIYQGYINISDGIIYTLVIKNDFSNVKSLLEQFTAFYKQVETLKRLNSFIFSFALYYKDVMEDSVKKQVEEEIRTYISNNYNIINCLLMECSPWKRDQVLRMTIESVKRFRFIDTKLFLKHLIQEDKEQKKNCSVM